MNKHLIARLETLYAELPKIECQGLCQESCGPISMSVVEKKRIRNTGRVPSCDEKLNCTLLNEKGQCSVYRMRPAICRLYGITPSMACKFGCEPEEWWTDIQGYDWLSRVFKVGGGEVWTATPEQVMASMGRPLDPRIAEFIEITKKRG